MAGNDLYDKRRGQRMLLTKWVKSYNSTDDKAEKERAAQKVADVLAWARSIGMSPSEKRDLPHRALELFQTGGGSASPADDAEVREAAREVASAVDTSRMTRLGEGSGSVYAYGYECVPDRLKIGRSDRDVVTRIVNQVNESTPDRPVLHVLLRHQAVKGGGKEWYRTTVAEIVMIHHSLLGCGDGREPHAP